MAKAKSKEKTKNKDKDKNQDKAIESLATYSLLGRSGLRVSPLCLGTMTFGNADNWGSDEDTARSIFQRYIDAGGNFIDTADMYTGGDSEKMVGKFTKDMANRDSLVIATKFTFNQGHGPNAGGNGRKHMIEACEASLRRLKMDYIDLYWMHAWDRMTPAEEVMYAFDALVRDGKVRYVGFSDIPAWYLGRAQTIAEMRGWEKLCALQLEYSLVERNIEFEYVDAAHEMGLGICPWSPLGSGVLTGKYKREGKGNGKNRLEQLKDSGNPVFNKLTDKNFDIADKVVEIADKLGKSPAQVALNWATKRPGITSTIIGASKMKQLEDNLGALEFDIPDELFQELNEVSEPKREFPYVFFTGAIQNMVTGGATVKREPDWYRE